VATEQEVVLFSLSDHQSNLFQIHSSLHPEISDKPVKVAYSFSLKNSDMLSDSAFDWSNS